MSELERQMLSKRAMMYVNRKKPKLDDELKKELLSVTTIIEKQIPTTIINGKIIPNGQKYNKTFSIFYYLLLIKFYKCIFCLGVYLDVSKFIPKKLEMETFFVCLSKNLR